MNIYYRLTFFTLVGLVSCTPKNESPKDYLFEKNIKFNHLYVVIDSTTYNYLSDSLSFLNDFSMMKESHTDAGDESWSGKYLHGKNHYLEIFKPEGYQGAKLGDFGMGFMPNKLGTLDSLYQHWSQRLDSVERDDRTIVDNGVTYPWFTALSIPNFDSLQLNIWLMENDRADMLYYGFTEKDLLNEIEYWDYNRYGRAKNLKTSPDSITYNKLFDKVDVVHLVLSSKELIYLRQYLLDFGFTEQDNIFYGNDIDVKYEIDERSHFILKQVDFKLSDSLQKAEYSLQNIDIIVTGDRASFKFNYN